ncbi:hypothetical protein FRB99_004009, partial [Tulasnella sp. 403]
GEANEFGRQELQVTTYQECLQEIGRSNGWDAASIAKFVGGAALIGVGATVVAPAIAVGALSAVGFTSGGVAAEVHPGSIAAGLQSSIFGAFIPAGSWFSACQAAAMGGIAVAAPLEVAAGVAAMAAGTGAVLSRNEKGDPDRGDQETAEGDDGNTDTRSQDEDKDDGDDEKLGA